MTGGYVYRGSAHPAWDGLYFFADYCSGRIWTVPQTGGEPLEMIDTALQIASFAEDAEGEIYVLPLGTSGIYRVVPAL